MATTFGVAVHIGKYVATQNTLSICECRFLVRFETNLSGITLAAEVFVIKPWKSISQGAATAYFLFDVR